MKIQNNNINNDSGVFYDGVINKKKRGGSKKGVPKPGVSKKLKGRPSPKKGKVYKSKDRQKPDGMRNRDWEKNPALYEAWILCVKSRDGFKCIVTGETTHLETHHLDGFDWAEQKRYDVKNGVTLSKKVHKQFHKQYGSGKNTVEQFEDFLAKNYNIIDFSKFPWKDNHEPSPSLEEKMEKAKTYRENMMEDFIKRCEKNNHLVLPNQTYVNAKSHVKIKCLVHNIEYETTFTNYKKSKGGLPCCGRELQKQSLKANRNNSIDS
uniref:Putative DNA endonuclease n=1 Tax=Oogamochlamys gigantea TaxID=158507 RepID=A0A0S2LNM5_9CHLO|nr:putative DNA endonuclease [Oogamochlamys gigantea]ALO62838.1 putative DNA endonuclease [Oogamochlamys gigantea]